MYFGFTSLLVGFCFDDSWVLVRCLFGNLTFDWYLFCCWGCLSFLGVGFGLLVGSVFLCSNYVV